MFCRNRHEVFRASSSVGWMCISLWLSPRLDFSDKGWVEISIKICPVVLSSTAQWSCIFMKAVHYTVANALCV